MRRPQQRLMITTGHKKTKKRSHAATSEELSRLQSVNAVNSCSNSVSEQSLTNSQFVERERLQAEELRESRKQYLESLRKECDRLKDAMKKKRLMVKNRREIIAARCAYEKRFRERRRELQNDAELAAQAAAEDISRKVERRMKIKHQMRMATNRKNRERARKRHADASQRQAVLKELEEKKRETFICKHRLAEKRKAAHRAEKAEARKKLREISERSKAAKQKQIVALATAPSPTIASLAKRRQSRMLHLAAREIRIAVEAEARRARGQEIALQQARRRKAAADGAAAQQQERRHRIMTSLQITAYKNKAFAENRNKVKSILQELRTQDLQFKKTLAELEYVLLVNKPTPPSSGSPPSRVHAKAERLRQKVARLHAASQETERQLQEYIHRTPQEVRRKHMVPFFSLLSLLLLYPPIFITQFA